MTQSVMYRVIVDNAEVVKLVDAVDSKSTEFLTRAGSSPAFGTIKTKNKEARHLYKLTISHFAYFIREEILEELHL